MEKRKNNRRLDFNRIRGSLKFRFLWIELFFCGCLMVILSSKSRLQRRLENRIYRILMYISMNMITDAFVETFNEGYPQNGSESTLYCHDTKSGGA